MQSIVGTVLVLVMVAVGGGALAANVPIRATPLPSVVAAEQSQHNFNVSAGNPYLFRLRPDVVEPETWVLFKQCDPVWGHNGLGRCSLTICQAGCAMTSVAMILHTKGMNLNPSSLNKWLDREGGYVDGCDIVWASVDKMGRTTFQGIFSESYTTLCSKIREGHGVVANVMNGEHWVLLTGCDGSGNYYVNDPGYDRNVYPAGDVLREAIYRSP